MIIAASLVLLLSAPALAEDSLEATAPTVAVGVSDATRALETLEALYGACALRLLDAHAGGDARVVRAVAHRHARLAGLHQALLIQRARLYAAEVSEREVRDADAAIDEILVTAQRLLAEASGPDVAALGAALERADTPHPISRREQLRFAEGTLEEGRDYLERLGWAAAEAQGDEEALERLSVGRQALVALLMVTEDALLTLALTEQPERAEHEHRKIAVALVKMREQFERANQDAFSAPGETSLDDRACARLVERYWGASPRTEANLIDSASRVSLEFWEADWWADQEAEDRYQRCVGDS